MRRRRIRPRRSRRWNRLGPWPRSDTLLSSGALLRAHDGRIHLGKNKRWLFQLERSEGSYGTNVTLFDDALRALGIGSRFGNDFAADLGIAYP